VAEPIKRTDLALAMLCAWNNIRPDQAPPEWWNHPDDLNRIAWERVAEAARAHLAPTPPPVPAVTREELEAVLTAKLALVGGAFLSTEEILDAILSRLAAGQPGDGHD